MHGQGRCPDSGSWWPGGCLGRQGYLRTDERGEDADQGTGIVGRLGMCALDQDGRAGGCCWRPARGLGAHRLGHAGFVACVQGVAALS